MNNNIFFKGRNDQKDKRTKGQKDKRTNKQNNKKQAQIAEREAKRIEYHAKDAAALAGKIRVQIIALTHKAKIAAEMLDDLSKKAETEFETQKKYQAAEALAAEKNVKPQRS